jgi:plastocyanin
MPARSLATLAAIAFVACSSSPTSYGGNTGGGGGTGGGASVTAAVDIGDFFFAPAAVVLQVGGTVTWTNNGPSGHTVTSDAGSFDSGTLGPPTPSDPYGGTTEGGTYQRTFSAAGTFDYHCAIHPGMRGRITVQ